MRLVIAIVAALLVAGPASASVPVPVQLLKPFDDVMDSLIAICPYVLFCSSLWVLTQSVMKLMTKVDGVPLWRFKGKK